MRKGALWAAITVVVVAPSAVRTDGLPTDRAAIEHVLNRLTFGPRPGDVEAVERIGLAAWIERQLHPSRIDDSTLQARLPAPPEPPRQVASPREARQFGRQSVEALSAAKIIRAVYSERQLEEVLVDFWFNHFNVFAGKGRTALFVADYEQQAIRPHVWGRFRDLLGATAKHPAMLFYLDNWLSVDPSAAERIPAVAQGRRRGLNENYARELLELHTLGVDGGYTQADVVEVARAFTGWTIAGPGRGARRGGGTIPGNRLATQQMADLGSGTFRFMPFLHDRREKVVLGHRIPAGGGIEDGERVLDILAAHPSTARHIAYKLARRFVSDDPPEALVARVAVRFRETDGNLREVVRAIVTSPEFFAAEARRAKVKTPFEFVVSALRATGRDVTDARPMLRALQELGMRPYLCEPPTGYDDDAETWLSPAALVARMTIAHQIAGPRAATTIGGPEFQRR
jgi:uncharacterized protein (DUF1800 family)